MRIQGDANIRNLVKLVKNGLQWASLSQFRLVTGVLCATGLILAIVDGKKNGYRRWRRLSSSSEIDCSSEKPVFVPGLRNLGNNCFLNVVLQALASCTSFHPFLKDIVEKDGFSADERVESMPLTVAMVSLFSELCYPIDESLILSPRRVMLAMDHYIPDFNLTMQQDAGEALLHLLSSLKDEFSESYVQHNSSLADSYTLAQCRIYGPNAGEGLNELERWRQHFLGPFNGILGSSLTCTRCSTELSMDFEYFHSLPLSPLRDGCSLEDCLKQFTAVELIENYRCNHCWHVAARRYLSTKEGHETHIEKLKSCVEEDSCECRNLFPREVVPWSNAVSRTLKQLHIARCPKILCVHLQRASVNEFGELIKLQGHISFPMVLDLFPFTKDAVEEGIQNMDKHVRRIQVHQPLSPILQFSHFNIPYRMREDINGPTRDSRDMSSEPLVAKDLGSIKSFESEISVEAFQHEPSQHHWGDHSYSEFTGLRLQSEKINDSCSLLPSKSYMYRLVSVVEHFGQVGSGHYTVYRRVRGSDGVDSNEPLSHAQSYWFCISDSSVTSVSEDDVLSAQASLLFYEKIEQLT